MQIVRLVPYGEECGGPLADALFSHCVKFKQKSSARHKRNSLEGCVKVDGGSAAARGPDFMKYAP